MSCLLAGIIVRFAARLLPPAMQDWGRAMEAEVRMIDRALPALVFAFGCLAGALRQAMAGTEYEGGIAMRIWNGLSDRPQLLGALCAAFAIGLGLVYMAAAGAPGRYLVVNAAAYGIGCLAIGLLAMASRASEGARGVFAVALAVALLLTGLWGVSAGGVTRWVSAGGLLLQPGLLFLPILALHFARSRNGLSTLAMLIAAFALALQPDRALAGALAAGMATLAWLRPERNTLLAATAALAGFAAAMMRPDLSPAAPFVDQIFYSSFAIHPLAGAAVLAGAVLVLVPALAGSRRDTPNLELYLVFGAVWLTVILAAALGRYPTPLVGYGGSAIVGYMIGLIGLPRRASAAPMEQAKMTAPKDGADRRLERREALSIPV